MEPARAPLQPAAAPRAAPDTMKSKLRGLSPMTTAHSTTYSFTEKKRIRKNFGKRRSILEVPFLLAIQVDSYREFLQADADPARRDDRGLHAALKSVFPIVSYNANAATAV
jgi:DNA-directed RNA polymerase subunit beta